MFSFVLCLVLFVCRLQLVETWPPVLQNRVLVRKGATNSSAWRAGAQRQEAPNLSLHGIRCGGHGAESSTGTPSTQGNWASAETPLPPSPPQREAVLELKLELLPIPFLKKKYFLLEYSACIMLLVSGVKRNESVIHTYTWAC